MTVSGLSGGPNAPRVLAAEAALLALQGAPQQDSVAIAAATENLETTKKTRDDLNAKRGEGGKLQQTDAATRPRTKLAWSGELASKGA